MLSKFTLRAVDSLIFIFFAAVLAPIFLRLGHDKYSPSAFLGHFADMLAVLAAVYAGRTVFFKTSDGSTDGTQSQKYSQNNTVEVASEEKAGGQGNDKSDVLSQDGGETPKRVYGFMVYLLIGYATIRCVQFWLIGSNKSAENLALGYLLLFLMAMFVAPFSWIAFYKAINEGTNVFFRILLGLIFPVSALVIGMWWISKNVY